MLQYKTTCIPSVPFKGASKSEFYSGLSVDTCNKAIAPIGLAIQNEAKGGWTLHSIDCLPQRIIRKKSFFELIFGWIPLLGPLFFPSMKDAKNGADFDIYVLVFVKEV